MYGALAKFYDKFMCDFPYDKWLDFLVKQIGDLKNGADLACGTGKITLGLISKGYDVYGVDNSEDMLREAVSRADEMKLSAVWIKGDINKFKFLNKLDFVTAMCDALNYVKTPINLFKNVYNNLVSGGKFIFDISSEYKLKNILATNTYSQEIDDITYIWQNYLLKNCVEMELTFFEPSGALYKKTSEVSRQYIHKTADVLAALESVGFKASAFGALSKRPVAENTERVFFTAVKN